MTPILEFYPTAHQHCAMWQIPHGWEETAEEFTIPSLPLVTTASVSPTGSQP